VPEVQTPSDYYKRAVALPLLDHLQSEMKTYLNPTNDAVLVDVGNRNPDIEAALEFYGNDVPSPHVVDGRRSGAALRMPTFPPVQFRHSHYAIESSFLTSTP